MLCQICMETTYFYFVLVFDHKINLINKHLDGIVIFLIIKYVHVAIFMQIKFFVKLLEMQLVSMKLLNVKDVFMLVLEPSLLHILNPTQHFDYIQLIVQIQTFQ